MNTLLTPVLALVVGCATGTQTDYTEQDTRVQTYAEWASKKWPSDCLPLREDRLKREEDRGKCLYVGPLVPAAPTMLCTNFGIHTICR